MKDSCSISEFYLMLKLGFFKSAKVENRGYFSISSINEHFLRKPLSAYQDQYYAKKQLAIGLYLLDSYLLSKSSSNTATYLLIIAVCQTTLEHKENIYIVKVSDIGIETDVISLLNEGVPATKKRKSVFRKRSRKPYFDSSPLNSVPRK